MSVSLEKEWYTIKETSEILGVSMHVIRNRITKITDTPTYRVKETEYKKEGIYLIHRDYIYRCMDAEGKEWYSITEASEFLNLSVAWLYNRIEKKEIPEFQYQKVNTLHFIHHSYLTEQKEFQDNIRDNYYSFKEVSQIISRHQTGISESIGRGLFKDVLHFCGRGYISKKEIDQYKELTKDTILTRVIEDELNLSRFQALELIKNEPQLEGNLVNNSFYVKKGSYQKFKQGLDYSIETASEFLNVTEEIAEMLVGKKHIKSFNVKGLGLRTSKQNLEEYLCKDEIPLEQLAMEMDKKVNAFTPYIRSGELKTIRKDTRKHFIRRKDADEFKNSFTAIRIKHFNTDNYNELFKDAISFFRNDTQFKDTVDLYEVWAKKKIDKSNMNKKVSLAYSLINLFLNLLSVLKKEIFLYTDEDLKHLFKALSDHQLRLLYPFINNCKSKRQCLYKGDYLWKEDKKNKKNDVPYTKKEWRDLTLDVLDLDKHFNKAFERKKYAEIWLWTLLHFSLDWRKKDLVKFKPINLDVIGIDSFEWFNQNTFTLEMAQTILKIVERSLKGVKANKNNVDLVFVIPFIFELPTALAFVLCELHRKQVDKEEKKLITSSIQTNDLILFFGESLPKFSNRRSSKTLTTYGWETAVKKGKGALAYWLGGFARSHTHKIDMPNPVTQVYIVTKNTDADVEEMALHAFERGIFGWQVKVMIDAINNHEPLSLDEMTKAISEVNKTYSPMMVDSLSKYAVTRHEQSVSLLKQLMCIPKNELKKKLEEISKLQSPSLLDYSQCLVGVKNCPYMGVEYNLETPCLGCKNRIDTNYILDIINVELFSLIDRLKATSLSDETSRIKYTHMIRTLTYILFDFRMAYDKYDENYIRSFIDIDKLKKLYKEVEFTKFLHIGEEVKE